MSGETIITIVGNLTADRTKPQVAGSASAADDPWSVGNAGIGGKFPTDDPVF